MTEKQYDKDNPRFRDEFGCVNDLQTGESYLCGESGFIGERDAGDTAIALCDLLNDLHNENEQLKAQLYCDSDEGVCIICKHHYLEKGNIFYISKCEKGHEECSKEDLRHCKDFEVKELENG